MRTGPSLTDLNNRMILWEYERALRKGKRRLAENIGIANPQIDMLHFVMIDALVSIS